jgi:phosphate transport system permease protein
MSADPNTSQLFKTERIGRRKLVNRLVEIAATVSALLAVAVLAIVIGSVAKRGAGAISIDFLTKTPVINTGFGEPQPSGIANAIIGTAIIVGLAVLMALPVGVLTAIYLNELAPPRISSVLTLALDVLNGIPAIVIGIFVFVFLVVGHGQSALKAGFALAILMLPIVARSTQEVLALVPSSLREASLALGAAKWRTTLSVVLPQAVGGIVTGATLATMRVAGETAPLLFTSSLVANDIRTSPTEALETIPMFIFKASEQADPVLQEQAWGAALVLIAFILVTSLLARAFAARSRRRLLGER